MRRRHFIKTGLIFVPSLALAQPSRISRRAGIIAARAVPTGGGAVSYLLQEDCEGAGTPAGWSDSAGAPNWDYSAVPLAGSQSLLLNTGDRSDSPTWVATSPVYGFFTCKFGVAPASTSTFYSIRKSDGSTNLISLEYRTSGAVNMTSNDGSSGIELFIPTPGTQYYIWPEYTAGSGANGLCEGYMSTTQTKPGSYTARIINSGSTASSGILRVSGADTTTVVLDTIRISASSIGSNPA